MSDSLLTIKNLEVELGGKRKLREQVAAVTISAGEARVANAMRKGIAEVKRLYFQAVLARRDIEVAIENRQMFQQLVQFNLARFQEGAIPEADLIKVRLERIKFDSALKQAELREPAPRDLAGDFFRQNREEPGINLAFDPGGFREREIQQAGGFLGVVEK